MTPVATAIGEALATVRVAVRPGRDRVAPIGRDRARARAGALRRAGARGPRTASRVRATPGAVARRPGGPTRPGLVTTGRELRAGVTTSARVGPTRRRAMLAGSAAAAATGRAPAVRAGLVARRATPVVATSRARAPTEAIVAPTERARRRVGSASTGIGRSPALGADTAIGPRPAVGAAMATVLPPVPTVAEGIDRRPVRVGTRIAADRVAAAGTAIGAGQESAPRGRGTTGAVDTGPTVGRRETGTIAAPGTSPGRGPARRRAGVMTGGRRRGRRMGPGPDTDATGVMPVRATRRVMRRRAAAAAAASSPTTAGAPRGVVLRDRSVSTATVVTRSRLPLRVAASVVGAVLGPIAAASGVDARPTAARRVARVRTVGRAAHLRAAGRRDVPPGTVPTGVPSALRASSAYLLRRSRTTSSSASSTGACDRVCAG